MEESDLMSSDKLNDSFWGQHSDLCCFILMAFCAFVQAVPPSAENVEVTLTNPNEVLIGLNATDDGQPDPPGKLTYSITSLPEHGWLYDPNDGWEIMADDVPYTLQNDGNSVIYQPCPYYFSGDDVFSYKANDGGEDPNDGDSNIANVNVLLEMSTVDTIYEVNTNLQDYIPFWTAYKKVRTQALYHASELGDKSLKISHLALNIQQAPAIEIQNWTIRMKHTTESDYVGGSAEFDNSGWAVVYDSNETITGAGWHEFVLNTEFLYDGVNNLLIDFSFDNSLRTLEIK